VTVALSGIAGNDVPTEVWNLDFTYRAPRRIVIGDGQEDQRTVWYMVYRVVNRSNQPRQFLPKFTLVTKSGMTIQDAVLPSVDDKVAKIENLGKTIKNSVTIGAEPIAAERGQGQATGVYGVACWESSEPIGDEFKIYVTGLTNAYVRVADPDSKAESVRFKTLEIDFQNVGSQKTARFAGHARWLYR
jgi:hypothetical protein